MEMIGVESIVYDAEILVMLDDLFGQLLRNVPYDLEINFLGCNDDRIAFIQKLKSFLENSSGICAQCIQRKERNPMRIFDCKNETCNQIYKNAPHITDSLCECCNADWQQLQNHLNTLEVNYIHKPTLVRGLDYYNKTVFEFSSNALGAQNAFCGGGRYNSLVKELGAKEDQPSIGAAIGIERLVLLLETQNYGKIDEKPVLNAAIIALSPAEHSIALGVAHQVRNHGMSAEVLCEGSMKSMLRKADKLGVRFVIIIGETEAISNTVMIKNMKTGQGQTVSRNEVIDHLAL
jgi:histidyl-tRNA synthetase